MVFNWEWNFGLFLANFPISSWREEGHKPSRAKLKILQLKLWLEPAPLGLILYWSTTSDFTYVCRLSREEKIILIKLTYRNFVSDLTTFLTTAQKVWGVSRSTCPKNMLAAQNGEEKFSKNQLRQLKTVICVVRDYPDYINTKITVIILISF